MREENRGRNERICISLLNLGNRIVRIRRLLNLGRRDESGSAAETRGKNGVSGGIRIWELGKPHEEQVVEVEGLGWPLQRLAHGTSSQYVQSGI